MPNDKVIPALGFDALTPLFDSIVSILGLGDRVNARVIDLLRPEGAETLLDVGCGTGAFLALARRWYPDLTLLGIDADPKILAIARAKLDRATGPIGLLQASAGDLPCADGTVDVAVSKLVFHHLPTEVKRAAFREVYRVLRSNGRFLVADFGRSAVLFRSASRLLTPLHVPELESLRDNVTGKLPGFAQDAGFVVWELAPPDRGVHFLLCQKW